MLRKIAAVAAGLLTVGLVVSALQQVSSAIYPLPEGLVPTDPASSDALRDHLATMPPAAWAIAFLSELVGGFFGGLVAGWLASDSPRPFSGAIVGMALVFSSLNWFAFEHPLWFIVGQLVGYPLVLLGVWAILAKKRSPEAGAGEAV